MSNAKPVDLPSINLGENNPFSGWLLNETGRLCCTHISRNIKNLYPSHHMLGWDIHAPKDDRDIRIIAQWRPVDTRYFKPIKISYEPVGLKDYVGITRTFW